MSTSSTSTGRYPADLESLPEGHIEQDLVGWIAALGRMSTAHPDLLRVLHVIDRLGDRPYRTHCLITGEAGTGKEGLARVLHRLMAPKGGPLETVSTLGADQEELGRLLFGEGREAGGRNQPGALFRAAGGTVIIDEVLCLGAPLQRRLLESLRRGGPDPVILAMSDGDPLAAVNSGLFRHDLYYRLARLPMRLPPLRERPQDIQPAALWMVNRILSGSSDKRRADLLGDAQGDRGAGDGVYQVLPEAIQALLGYPFPGNFREMEAVLEQAVLLYSDGHKLTAEDVRAALPSGPAIA